MATCRDCKHGLTWKSSAGEWTDCVKYKCVVKPDDERSCIDVRDPRDIREAVRFARAGLMEPSDA